MDAYAQYARWRGPKRVGLGNRRLAGLLGDFVYETSSAEDESRRILELLYEQGRQALSVKADLKDLDRFTSEHNRDERRAEGVNKGHISWDRMDQLAQQTIHVLSDAIARSDSEFVDNLAALDRLFSTTKALRKFRNLVDHRAPSDQGGPLHFYRDAGSPVTVRAIWGWTEVAASYWINLIPISTSISMATGIRIPALGAVSQPLPLSWPPSGTSIHGLRVLQQAAIPVSQHQLRDARKEWTSITRRWNRSSS